MDAKGRLARTFWADRIGVDYIELALREARSADPTSRLVINERDVERPGPKADTLFELVRKLKARGVPLDAVGFETHLDSPAAAPSSDTLVALMARYAAIGIDVEITEMDVAAPASSAPRSDRSSEQADAYQRVARACRDAGNCVASRFRAGDRRRSHQCQRG